MSNSNTQSFEEMMKELEKKKKKLDNENVSLELMSDENTDNNDDTEKVDSDDE